MRHLNPNKDLTQLGEKNIYIFQWMLIVDILFNIISFVQPYLSVVRYVSKHL